MDDLEDLRAARARLLSELVGERRRIERALHDGVQQDLTALAVELQLAADERLDQLRREAHAALEAVQSLAESVYPPLLDAGGLAAALPGLARRAGIRLRLTGREARADPAAESAVAFACRAVFEAAPDEAVLGVTLQADGTHLRVELEPVHTLPPLARDLVAGAGGTVEVERDRVVFSI